MIGRIFRGLVILVIALIVAVGALFAGARLHDGPLALIPGGPLVKGTLVADKVTDWSFAQAVPEIEMQLAYENSSRTTWIVVHESRAYIPCSLKFPPGKRWYKAADQNGEAVLRIDGKRYPVTLSRVKDDALFKSVGQTLLKKYPNVPPGEGEGNVWLFEITSRAAAG
jgi:hypothetical protein